MSTKSETIEIGGSGKVRMIPISVPQIDDESIQAVIDVLKSGSLAQGKRVEEFEEAFASYIGTRYAIATNNGTTALHAAFLAAGISKGDEIITTPFSFIASANAALFCDAKPVFSDIDPDTFNINPDEVIRKITKRTKAIEVVHLYGQPCDMDRFVQICQSHGLILIEDACQAHGAEYRGKKVGSFGIGCFSFYPTKNITTGEGGMITTDDKDIAEKARMIRNQGQKERYHHEILGYNYRMTEMAGALGLCQLKRIDEFTRKRLENAAFLTREISKITGLVPPFVAPNVKHVFHQFTVRVTKEYGLSRDGLRTKLQGSGIGTGVHYPIPIHKQPVYMKMGYKDHLPNAETAAAEVLSLPVFPGLEKEDLRSIVGALTND